MPGGGFVTGGTWCVDLNLTVPCWPAEETATPVLASERRGGGSACNFAANLRRLDRGIPVATIGLRGDDADGAFLAEVAAAHGIDAARLRVAPGLATHRTMAFTARDNARRTHLFEAGVADALTPDHFDLAGLAGRMLHLGLPGTHARLDGPWGRDANGWIAVLRRARAAGLTTNMEVMTIPPGDLRRLVAPCLPHLDHLVVNDREIAALAGRDGAAGGDAADPAAVEDAARAVLARGPMRFVVVHFPHGAVAVERGGAAHRQPSVAMPAGAIRGTNGAGDAFAAGLFCGLARGGGLPGALALAHAAAAASLRAVGTYDAVEDAEACLALARRHGWRDGMAAGP